MQPDVYSFAESLSLTLDNNISISEALLVNSIVDFSSFCTSIVAITEEQEIIHVRNLDFDFPKDMQQLMYIQKIVKDGIVVGRAPSIAGFYGTYTGLTSQYSFSYNVRFSTLKKVGDERKD